MPEVWPVMLSMQISEGGQAPEVEEESRVEVQV